MAGALCGTASRADDPPSGDTGAPTLEQTRIAMGKWIETQQIIARERNEWQQGREILAGRLELVKKEVEQLKDKIGQAEASVAEATKKREELAVEADSFKSATTQLTEAVTSMESQIRRLHESMPEPVRTKLEPLYQRIPEDPHTSRVAVAERYQNVLGILNELNKANNEITVNYEIHTLANGKPSEVRAMYIGLAQAYYVSAGGEAGIGRPSPQGWKWEPTKSLANDILLALDILHGKQSPAFVPLPVKLQ